MEIFIPAIILLSLLISIVYIRRRNRLSSLPPSPPALPILGNLLWLSCPFSEIEQILRELFPKLGPIVNLKIGLRDFIFVSDRHLAHQILVQGGAGFAGRPPVGPATKSLTGNQHTINGLSYGPLWRILRRNLSSGFLNQVRARVRVFSQSRNWVLGILLEKLRVEAARGKNPVSAVEFFQHSMFCLLVFMCFGEKFGEKTVQEIENIQREILLYLDKLAIFAFLPIIGKFLLRNRWRKIMGMREKQKGIFLPLIRARQKWRNHERENFGEASEGTLELCYLDTLLDLEVPDSEGKMRELEDEEIVSLCSEFLNGGTDTTVTALQWIMANLVKNQEIQRNLMEEIKSVEGEGKRVEEEDLGKLPYLKAVVMEGLRRHPPGHFLLPHAAMNGTLINGYLIPKSASLNFLVTEVNWSSEVWEDPMEFRPERFLVGEKGEDVDLTGTREIKMMTFGAGRRICPGMGLAVLHLEFFVANLVKEFEWEKVEGEEVDMEEKAQFTVGMKSPLRAQLFPRFV